MRNTDEGAHFHQNGRQTACSFIENEPATGIPQVYLKMNDYFKEYPSMVASNISFTIKVKILFTKFLRID